MAVHAFIDESRRGRLYIVAMALFRPSDLHNVRGQLRRLCLPGQRRVHFKTEQTTRQQTIVASLLALGVHARLYLRSGPDIDARADCLAAAASDLVKMSAHRLVLESRQDRDRIDRRVIRAALTGAGAAADGDLVYEHLRPSEDPLLWPPDALAWCYGAGGAWRRRISPMLDEVIDLNAP